jgi:hypothetical protein
MIAVGLHGADREPARAASQSTIAGALGALASLSLIAFYATLAAGGGDGNAFGAASDLLGSCACAAMIPVALALGTRLRGPRSTRTTRIGLAAMAIGAAGGPLLVAGIVDFGIETPASVAATLVTSAWLTLTSRSLAARHELPRQITRLGERLGGGHLASAVAVAACLALLPWGSWPQIAALAITGTPGVIAWLAQPIWFLALGRVLARHATSAGGTEPIELAPPRRARGRALLRRLRRWARWLHATLALAVVARGWLRPPALRTGLGAGGSIGRRWRN